MQCVNRYLQQCATEQKTSPAYVSIIINDIFVALTPCDMCNKAADNTLNAYSRDFRQI